VVEGARLESEYTAKPYRGFESLPLRQNLSQHGHARTPETANFCDKFLISLIAASAFVRVDLQKFAINIMTNIRDKEAVDEPVTQQA
jgi:hypothetical protein